MCMYFEINIGGLQYRNDSEEMRYCHDYMCKLVVEKIKGLIAVNGEVTAIQVYNLTQRKLLVYTLTSYVLENRFAITVVDDFEESI